jgi:hypothetical protein
MGHRCVNSKCARKYHRNGKGKIHPRKAMEDAEREWKYSSTLSLTSALDGGGWLMPLPGRFTPRKETPYQLNRRLVGPQDPSGRVWKVSLLPGLGTHKNV